MTKYVCRAEVTIIIDYEFNEDEVKDKMEAIKLMLHEADDFIRNINPEEVIDKVVIRCKEVIE